MNETSILGFFKDYRFLSNFHCVDVNYEGMVYPSSENAFQAAKQLDPKARAPFMHYSPAEARKAGQLIQLRVDWEFVKERIMYDVNWKKFTQDKTLTEKLLATHSVYLEETNTWGDTYWGVCDGKGRNRLGLILMSIRKNIRDDIATTKKRSPIYW